MPNIRNFLDISTAHLEPKTREDLSRANLWDWPCSGGKTIYGFFIRANEHAPTVERIPSPWTVVLDDGRWTPVGLITSFDRSEEKPSDKPKGQLSLF